MSKPYALPAANYLILANAYADAVIRYRFTEREQTLLRIFERRAWGWGNATMVVDAGAIAAELGLWPKQVEEAIAKLLEYGVLYQDGEEVGIQADASRWTAPLRKSRDRKRSFANDLVNANDHLQKSNDHLQNRKRSFANEGAKPADTAESAEPKDSSKDTKDTPPPTGVPQGDRLVGGLGEIAKAIEWGEGEQDRFLGLVTYKRLRDLGMAQRKTAELIKVYLSASKETREATWAYVDARLVSTEIDKPRNGITLAFVVGYLQDPSSYPAIANKGAFLAQVEIQNAAPAHGNPWKDKPFWKFFDPRFVGAAREDERGQVMYLANQVDGKHRAAGRLNVYLVNTYLTKGLDEAMKAITHYWDKPAAPKEAAHG